MAIKFIIIFQFTSPMKGRKKMIMDMNSKLVDIRQRRMPHNYLIALNCF